MQPWIKAGLFGAVLEVAFSLPSYLDHFLPPSTGAIVEALSYIPGVLYCLLLPLVGVLAGWWIVKPTTYRIAILQGAAAGFLASLLDHIFTVLLRLGILAFENNGHLFSAQAALSSEMMFSTLVGIGVILAGTAFGMLGSLLYVLFTRSARPPLPVDMVPPGSDECEACYEEDEV